MFEKIVSVLKKTKPTYFCEIYSTVTLAFLHNVITYNTKDFPGV